jgi:hypothetical protein
VPSSRGNVKKIFNCCGGKHSDNSDEIPGIGLEFYDSGVENGFWTKHGKSMASYEDIFSLTRQGITIWMNWNALKALGFQLAFLTVYSKVYF